MSYLVPGLGDEVLFFLLSLLLGGLLLLAWASSFVGERPRVEAVLIQQMNTSNNRASAATGQGSDTGNGDREENRQRTRVLWADGPRRRGTFPESLLDSFPDVANEPDVAEQGNNATAATNTDTSTEPTSSEPAVAERATEETTSSSTEATPSSNQDSKPESQCDAEQEHCQANSSEPEASSSSSSETVEVDNQRAGASKPSEASVESKPSSEPQSTSSKASSPQPSTSSSSSTNSESVNIKVKFLNDTQREVKASLRDRLGRFKRNHLSDLLEQNQNVRLIFNGHVLKGEEQTLSQCGLFDNCVVHCLVTAGQQNSNQQQQGNNANIQADGGPNNNAPYLPADNDELDLSHLSYPLLGGFLLIIWWCQLVYSHYFTLSSTVSLVSLTVLFVVCLANTYLL